MADALRETDNSRKALHQIGYKARLQSPAVSLKTWVCVGVFIRADTKSWLQSMLSSAIANSHIHSVTSSCDMVNMSAVFHKVKQHSEQHRGQTYCACANKPAKLAVRL